MNLSDRIRTLRAQKKLSQAKLAQTLGVSRQAVSKWENGTAVPDMENLILLADVFETELSYLANGVESTTPLPSPAQPPPAPIVVNLVEKVDRVVERDVEKPVVRKVYRVRDLRNPIEFFLAVLSGFLLGILCGKLI